MATAQPTPAAWASLVAGACASPTEENPPQVPNGVSFAYGSSLKHDQEKYTVATQLLIYESAVPVNSQRHGAWSVKAGENYAFARHVNSVPLTAVEFANAAADYAIVFSGTDEAVMPAVILGLRNDENMYITDSGSWKAKYIPSGENTGSLS